MKKIRRITESEILRTLSGTGGEIRLEYCFCIGEYPCAWDHTAGRFNFYYVEDDLSLACADYISNVLDKRFDSLEKLLQHATENQWENLSELKTQLNAWIKNRDNSSH